MLHEISLHDADPMLATFQTNFPKTLAANGIYFCGSTPVRDRFHLGIVGSRRPTPDSRVLLESLLAQLRDCRLRVISGGALGVDAQSHFYALKNGLPTYSWVVGDPCRPTPYSNRHLFNLITEARDSAVMTPHCLYRLRNQKLENYFWIERNYWLAANVDALLVIQAKEKSGTWWTVKACQDFGVPVYALPGPLTDGGYSGNNLMISQAYAHPVHSLSGFADEIKRLVKNFRV